MRNVLSAMTRASICATAAFLMLFAAPFAASAQQNGEAQLRFVHLAPGLPAVDIFDSEGNQLADDLAPGQFSAWQERLPGLVATIYAAQDAPGNVLAELELAAGQWVTVAIFGTAEGIEPLIIRDELFSIPQGESRLVLLHAQPETPPLDVLLDGVLFFEELAYATASDPASMLRVDLIANTYDLRLVVDDDESRAPLEQNDLTLVSGGYYVVAVFDSDGPALVVSETLPVRPSVVISEEGTPEADAPGTALFRAGHLSSGTPPIDIYINGELPQTDNLRFPELTTRWREIEAGTYRVAITLAGESLSDALVGPFDVVFEEGSYTNLFAIGTLANNTLELHILREAFEPISPTSVRLSLFNAHPGVGPVDIRLADGNVLVPQLGYPGFFATNDGYSEVVLEAGIYDLELVNEQGDLIVALNNTQFIAGRNYFIAVISADPPFLLTFSDISETATMLEDENE